MAGSELFSGYLANRAGWRAGLECGNFGGNSLELSELVFGVWVESLISVSSVERLYIRCALRNIVTSNPCGC